MRKKNILLLLILISVNFLPFISNSVSALVFGNLTVYSPEVGEKTQYWNEIHIKSSAYPALFYTTYESTKIYIDNCLIAESSENNVDFNYGYYCDVGKHTIKFVATFTTGRFPITITEIRDFYITSAVDMQDFSDLQIDKLHNLYSLGGQGMTICVIDTGFGFKAKFNSINDYEYFPKNIYLDRFDSFREITYYRYDGSNTEVKEGFGKTHYEKEQIWRNIAYENSNIRDYENYAALHCSLVMSTLTQVAPHARYVIIDADLNLIDEAVVWLWENDRYIDYEIDVLSMSWGNDPEGDFCDNFELALNTMANDVDNPVIPIAATGNGNVDEVWAPAYYDYVIGVGGTLDSGGYTFADHFNFIDQKIWTYSNQYTHTWYDLIGTPEALDYGFGTYTSVGLSKVDIGSSYDGAHFHDSIEDGSIEGMFKGKNNQFLVGALWLRTGELTTGSVSFKSGYMLRLYREEFSMYRRYWDEYSQQSYWNLLVKKDLGTTWKDKWWRMKFKAVGNNLNGWLWKEDGTLFRTLTYEDRCEDQLTEGKPGFSARTNIAEAFTYIDEIKVTTFDNFVDYNGYDEYIHWNRATAWVPDLSNHKLGSQYGNGLDIYAIYYGTMINWNPYCPLNTFYNDNAFIGTSNACPLVAGIIALAAQYYEVKSGFTDHLNYLDLNDRTDSIFKSTGEVLGTAPIDNHSVYGNYTTSRGFGLIDAYEIILYINTHY